MPNKEYFAKQNWELYSEDKMKSLCPPPGGDMLSQDEFIMKYKKNQRTTKNAIGSNLTLKVEGQKAKIISPEVLAKLKDDQHFI